MFPAFIAGKTLCASESSDLVTRQLLPRWRSCNLGFSLQCPPKYRTSSISGQSAKNWWMDELLGRPSVHRSPLAPKHRTSKLLCGPGDDGLVHLLFVTAIFLSHSSFMDMLPSEGCDAMVVLR